MKTRSPKVLKDRLRRPPSLNLRDIHVWVYDAAPNAIENRELDVLSYDELSHSQEIESKIQRFQYQRGRILLRRLLSFYLECAPENVLFRHNGNGKPSLMGRSHRIRFNMTHTNNLLMVAVRRGGLLGIDAEILRDWDDLVEVAGQFFSAKELNVMRSGTANTRHELFYRFWTGKEACVKALGKQTSNLRFKRIDLSGAAKNESYFRVKPRLYVRWFSPVPCSVAAIACDSCLGIVRFFQWSDFKLKT